jgi:cell pole-organizing protein PopZ
MSETNAQEPTMEEILASIRRIISEDDAPADTAVAEAPKPKTEARHPTPVPPPAPPTEVAPPAAPDDDDDVLELTDPVEPEPVSAHHAFQETLGDLDVFSTPATAPALSAPPFAPAAPAFAAEPLIGSYASETSAGHFGALARSMAMPKDGRTLEDVVRELLKPLLRDWLDQNLPSIVEARVQAEVERIARRNEY